MIAAIVERPQDTALEKLISTFPKAFKGSLERRCPLSASLLTGQSPEDFRFYLAPALDAGWNRLVLSPGLRPQQCNWWRGVLEGLGRKISRSGLLTLPYWDRREAERKGLWSLPWLKQALGRPEALHRKDGMADFAPPQPANATRSVAAWYLNWIGEGHDLAALFPGDYRNQIRQSEECGLTIIPGQQARDAMWERLDWLYAPESFDVEKFFNYFDYNLRPVGTRSAMLHHFLQTYLPGRKDLRLVDCGGGAGFNLLELDLGSGRIGTTLNVDVSANNILPFLKARAALGDDSDRRHRYRLQPAQEYPFEEPADAVLFLTSLLYVPKEDLAATLDRAWDSLTSGGVLVVLEHHKSASFARDQHLMFTCRELDRLLQRYGSVHRWHAQSTIALTEEEAGTKTVYRLVVKP